MPVKLTKAFEKGWDCNYYHSPNDKIFVVTFTDEKTGRPLFKYGAKLTEIDFWIEYFAELGEYEYKKLHGVKTDSEKLQKEGGNSVEGTCNSSTKAICQKEGKNNIP